MTRDDHKNLTARNRRIAFTLALVAVSIYCGYVLVYYFDL